MLQEVIKTVDHEKVERFTNHQARFLMGVRDRVQATADSGDREALLMLTASIIEILDAAMDGSVADS